MSEENHSIAGGWLGTYYYRGLQTGMPPTRFEATFAGRGTDGGFTGSILDDGGGEAGARGVQSGSQVAFTKVYRGGQGKHLSPIEYEGTMSGDGRTLRGRWRIPNSHARGVWEARRLWSEEQAEERLADEAERAAERELTRT